MRFLILDDHPVVSEGLAAILRTRGDVAEIFFARSGEDAEALLAKHADIDLALVDLVLGEETGFSVMKRLSDLRPDLPLLVFSSSEDPGHVRTALARGALGYVSKGAAPNTLLTAISVVLAGEIYVPPFALGGARKTEAADGLTGRQLEILQLLAKHRSNKDIARELDLSEKTIKAHLGAIFRTLGVATRSSALAAAKAREIL